MDLPELKTADLEGPVAYREWEGPPDTAFVLLHGLGASHLSWIQVAEGLSGLGRVYALDLPGFGASPLAGRGARLMDQRRTVSRFIGRVGADRVVMGGNSMGGALSILQAAVEPSSVPGIVLTNSVFPWRLGAVPHPLILASFGVYATPGLGERVVSWRLRQMDPEQMVRLSLRVLAADPGSIPDDVVELLVDLTRERKDDPDVARSFLDAARSMLRLGRRPSVSRRALDNVVCPVLLLHGRRDRLVPAAFAEAELARHPAWRGRFFPDLGHIPQMEAPGRWLAEVADWFADTLD
ncbi:MAG TPA: alpha/beta fold hydrolase [Actinomycetota bacterium]|nr:alpha/beta fold hydrolase [Actinomycetota bacterium]